MSDWYAESMLKASQRLRVPDGWVEKVFALVKPVLDDLRTQVRVSEATARLRQQIDWDIHDARRNSRKARGTSYDPDVEDYVRESKEAYEARLSKGRQQMDAIEQKRREIERLTQQITGGRDFAGMRSGERRVFEIRLDDKERTPLRIVLVNSANKAGGHSAEYLPGEMTIYLRSYLRSSDNEVREAIEHELLHRLQNSGFRFGPQAPSRGDKVGLPPQRAKNTRFDYLDTKTLRDQVSRLKPYGLKEDDIHALTPFEFYPRLSDEAYELRRRLNGVTDPVKRREIFDAYLASSHWLRTLRKYPGAAGTVREAIKQLSAVLNETAD